MMLGRAASHTREESAATSGSTSLSLLHDGPEDLGLHSAQVLRACWVKCHDLRAAIRAPRPKAARANGTGHIFGDAFVGLPKRTLRARMGTFAL